MFRAKIRDFPQVPNLTLMTPTITLIGGRAKGRRLNSNRSALRAGDDNADHRRNNFDALRLFGSMLVLYGHAYALVGVPGPGFASNGVATIGVKIFFVISGYLVIASWLRDPHPLRYIQR